MQEKKKVTLYSYLDPFRTYALFSALFLLGEVVMDLIEPMVMEQIVDRGILQIDYEGTAGMPLILSLTLKMVLVMGAAGLATQAVIRRGKEKDNE